MRGINRNSKKEKLADVNNLTQRLGSFEHKHPEIVDPKYEKGETDYQKELRFAQLRKARREHRDSNPERYPPRRYWWDRGDLTIHCHYFPDDIPTQEEVDFYLRIAEGYNRDKPYAFHSYDTFLAFNRWHLEELDRWKDWEQFGHIHDVENETLADWKEHGPHEHHLHKEPPPRPRGWSSGEDDDDEKVVS